MSIWGRLNFPVKNSFQELSSSVDDVIGSPLRFLEGIGEHLVLFLDRSFTCLVTSRESPHSSADSILSMMPST